jgi:hypothetical protein
MAFIVTPSVEESLTANCANNTNPNQFAPFAFLRGQFVFE